MPEETTDLVRLTLPADPDLRPVVEVAIAVLARRVGVDDEAVREVRARAGEAFEAVCTSAGDDPVEVEALLTGREVVASIKAGAVERRVSAGRTSPDPPR